MSDPLALCSLIPEEHRLASLQGLSRDTLVHELLAPVAATFGLSEEDVESVSRAVLAREREATTGIGNGVAIPHMKACPVVNRITGVIGRLDTGVEWGAPDGLPVQLVFLVLTPEGMESEHVRTMRKIVGMSHDPKTVAFLERPDGFRNLSAIFDEADAAGRS